MRFSISSFKAWLFAFALASAVTPLRLRLPRVWETESLTQPPAQCDPESSNTSTSQKDENHETESVVITGRKPTIGPRDAWSRPMKTCDIFVRRWTKKIQAPSSGSESRVRRRTTKRRIKWDRKRDQAALLSTACFQARWWGETPRASHMRAHVWGMTGVSRSATRRRVSSARKRTVARLKKERRERREETRVKREKGGEKKERKERKKSI